MVSYLGLPCNVSLDFRKQLSRVHASLSENASREAVGLLQHRLHEVLGLHYLLAALLRNLRRRDNRLPRSFRELSLADLLPRKHEGSLNGGTMKINSHECHRSEADEQSNDRRPGNAT